MPKSDAVDHFSGCATFACRTLLLATCVIFCAGFIHALVTASALPRATARDAHSVGGEAAAHDTAETRRRARDTFEEPPKQQMAPPPIHSAGADASGGGGEGSAPSSQYRAYLPGETVAPQLRERGRHWRDDNWRPPRGVRDPHRSAQQVGAMLRELEAARADEARLIAQHAVRSRPSVDAVLDSDPKTRNTLLRSPQQPAAHTS